MKKINEITYKEIERLDPEQLVKLLHVLLCSEVRRRGICKANIHVPFNIVVADGGEDGRWDADLDPSDFIPNRLTVYQSKAEDMRPSECGKEVLKKRKDPAKELAVLKPKVKEVLERGGCYCFFCKAPYVKDQIDSRIADVRAALKQAGRIASENDQIVFLDGNKIAEWVNQHAGAIAFILECCGLARTDGFLSWEAWQKQRQDFTFPFEVNPYLQSRIAELQAHMVALKAIARIVGQSGLGKTRLAFEVFRPSKIPQSSLTNAVLSASMVYFDLDVSNAGYYDIVRQLAQGGIAGIIVVDNCQRSDHDKIAALVTMEGSNLSLLTLDYEPERIESTFLHIMLEPSQLEDLIPKMLMNVVSAKKLTDVQRGHIAQYCQGFPQLAVLLAESDISSVIEKLTEGKFARNLLWGRNSPDQDASRAIESLALFKHVGIQGDKAGQLTFIVKSFCPSFDERTFRNKCCRFQKMRVLQSAGDYWFVAPRPLAVALAAEWWKCATKHELLELLPGIEANGLIDAFCSVHPTSLYLDSCKPSSLSMKKSSSR